MSNASFPFDNTPISASASTMPLNSAPVLPVTSSDVPDIVRNPFDEFLSGKFRTFTFKRDKEGDCHSKSTQNVSNLNKALARVMMGGKIRELVSCSTSVFEKTRFGSAGKRSTSHR